jgi:hypothetical protein
MAVRLKALKSSGNLGNFQHEGSLKFTVHADFFQWVQNFSAASEFTGCWLLNIFLGYKACCYGS